MFYIILMVLMLCSCSYNETKPIPQETSEISSNQTPVYTPEITPQSTSSATEQPAEKPPADKRVLTEFSTPLLDTEENRILNIKLSAKAIDGYVLRVGEEFSFNGVVGERTAEKGYKEAAVLVGDEHTTGMGGGVCQVATTLYNAAKIGGFSITEHHTHKVEIAYAPEGTDATVNYDNLDFKFKNNSSCDVKINVNTDKDNVYVELCKY